MIAIEIVFTSDTTPSAEAAPTSLRTCNAKKVDTTPIEKMVFARS
jgi:hypothetical protein